MEFVNKGYLVARFFPWKKSCLRWGS